jgi:hypothetical protein
VQHLRELVLDDRAHGDAAGTDGLPFGDISRAWPALRALEVLVIRGTRGKLGALDLPCLKKLVRDSRGLSRGEVAAIARARLPILEHLHLRVGAKRHGCKASVAALRPILDGETMPVLAHLGVTGCEFIDELLAELARSKVRRRLRTLDISYGFLSEATSLVRHADALRGLESIDLRHNFLEDRERERIMTVLPNALVGDQHDPHDEEDARFGDLHE